MQLTKAKVATAFTPEQIQEQVEFLSDLENGKANIVFEGSVLEAKAFLEGVGELVDSGLH